MFRDTITTPISPIPIEYTNKISRIYKEPDYSLTCLGIAMLKHRIENYNGISGVFGVFSTKKDAYTNFIERVNQANDLPIFCYYIYNETNETELPEALSEFAEKQQIGMFIKEKTSNECQVLYHETKNIVGIFVNTRDLKIYHLLLSFISLYYPNLFKEKPMTEMDYTIVKSLSKPDKSAFFGAIKTAVKEYEEEFRRIQLTTLLQQMHEQRIDKARNDVVSQRDQINSIEREYGEAIETLKQLIVLYEGLKATESYDDVEQNLVEYLTNNKAINNLKIQDNSIWFDVATTLTNYNEEAWRIFKERGHIYDGNYRATLLDAFKSKENIKLLLDNIFSEDPKLVIKMCGNYRLNMRDCRVYTYGNYDYVDADPMYKSYIANPHLKLFECLGGYRDKVMSALLDRNFIGAIELCIASAGSVNLDETDQTFRPFLGWLLSSTEKVLMTKDGTEMTPEEALVWLHDEVKE